ncbi:MAG: tyrosine-type recombinase/integrase [Propionibacteriales bacterium]|nr:tyrosine-type recombinase/integrase [Propionibacteriales bacterium]
MIEKTSGGRFRARLKSGRQFIASRTFDTKREASEWLSREKAALAGGIDPRAGRRQVRILLEEWLVVREFTVAAKTYRSDQALQRLMPTSMQLMHVAAVSEREVARSFEQLIQRGLSERSVIRYRASLSTFFAWCVREKAVVRNPVTTTKVPRSSEEPTEMRPWTEAELEASYERWKARDPQLADVLLVLAWTGMRWGEARSVLVEDVVAVPTPGLLVRRSQSEGGAVKATKGRRGRRVPVADRVLPIIQRMASGKEPTDLLVTTAGGAQLHRNAVLRTVKWEQTASGRRIHDLRHTAACLWLARGVDPGTVQAWMGHESIATTNQYLHFLGTSADQAGLDRLNDPSRGPAPKPEQVRGDAAAQPRGDVGDADDSIAAQASDSLDRSTRQALRGSPDGRGHAGGTRGGISR